ncbi:NAD(P)/FAD-dependent oxidoreductase [Devosia sp.]|uniref:NAD(P)/FAD-dependent oxidoreductase n=1 Tax=Devosia sp. TaxID=1871048 RepID=UPI00292F7796|nr:NAD(P)/FAD-dependent oxidoreductase [Devosia sp.]
MDDVIIVGGSFAGLAAALNLGRARRQVTIVDTGLPRNRYASNAHGLLGHDGKPPSEILAEARAQLAPYETVRFLKARAASASGGADDFAILTDDGETLRARRLLLSYGIADQFPDIEGFAECWGKSVIHCPYCHGFEYAGQSWGLVYSTPMSLHAPLLYSDWTDKLTLFTDGNDIPEAERSKLDKRGVKLVEGKVISIQHEGGQLSSVTTADGAVTMLDALFAHPRIRPSADLHTQLGLETVETPFGIAVQVDDKQKTSRNGIYAAGDLVSPMHSLTIAIYTGAMAGVNAQQSMLV